MYVGTSLYVSHSIDIKAADTDTNQLLTLISKVNTAETMALTSSLTCVYADFVIQCRGFKIWILAEEQQLGNGLEVNVC